MNGNNNRFTSKQSAEELKLKAQLNPNFDIETTEDNQSHIMLSKSKPMTEVGNQGNFDLTTLNSSNHNLAV